MRRNISRRDLLTKLVPVSAATALAPKVLAKGERLAFLHGVASGDPTQSRVIIWTRVTTNQTKVEVRWQLASDADFSQIIQSGKLSADSGTDYTVKVDIASLTAGTSYFYRFESLDQQSVTGRTKTLPSGALSSFKLGVCSCSNYPAGYFNAYAAMAEDQDIDLVLHLGDYIYEYDALGYASAGAEALGRVSEPLHEVTGLEDFRRRHAQYKFDSDLQRLHARQPFIVSWDDHEFANDAWREGAQNHGDGEGSWDQRKRDALQAYFEWMPIRVPTGRPAEEFWRSFEIGDLATLVMLETRLSARDKQVDIARDMVNKTVTFDVSNPQNPILLDTQIANENAGETEVLKQAFDISANTVINDYQKLKQLAGLDQLPDGLVYQFDMSKFRTEVLDDPRRQLLGAKQRKFISQTLAASTKANKPWQIIGNQTLVAKVQMPNFAAQLSDSEKDALTDWVKPALELTRLGIPFGTDSWNGYGAEREWLLHEAATQESNMIVLTGDTHAAWCFDLESELMPGWQGVELGTTAISSPGLDEALGVNAKRLSELLVDTNSNLSYSETGHKGYLSLELTPEHANVEFHKISSITDKNFKSVGADKLSIRKRPTIVGKGIEAKIV